MSQVVAIISYFATVVESSSLSQWESYTVLSAYTVFGILDLAREIQSSYKEKSLASSRRGHIYRDIKWVRSVNLNLRFTVPCLSSVQGRARIVSVVLRAEGDPAG